MNRIEPRTRYAAFVLLLALLASLFIAATRYRVEQRTNRVELAVDYNDLLAFARSYNYNMDVLLVNMRRAGLTSLALSEELGGSLTSSMSRYGFAISGTALLDAARVSPLANPTLARLVRSNSVRADEVFILAYDKPSFDRYMQQLPLHFERSGIRVLHRGAPYVIALRTQVDYFNSVGLGIPSDQVSLARKLGFFVEPRLQNDERLQGAQIGAMFDDVGAGKWLSTAIFFGLRNQVLGFPDHLKDTADAFSAHPQTNFGMIETGDPTQAQKGYAELAKLIPGRTVRVQAISKPELDKLTVPVIVARYELGARERNVRVVYLRPFLHAYNGLSGEKTNVEIVREIALDLRGHGFRLGRASPVPQTYKGNSPLAVGMAALAAPSMFVLLLGWYGAYRRRWAVAAYALTVLVIAGGYLSHHDVLARSVVALAGALLFAAAAFTALDGAFNETPKARFGAQLAVSIRWTVLATVVALLGALTVVGVMSAPLLMEEVDTFRGVKLVLGLPPLIALALYLFTSRFNARLGNAREAFAAPIRIYQIIVACIVLGAGALLLMRSGNQSDIAPSNFELALRHHLTALLSVRPRFKEFVLGFPLMMLVPALTPSDRRICGILLALAAGIGIGDVIDTFSHLHTPLLISLERVFLGLVLGILIGALFIALYRRFRK
ncbi:MAG: DUF5693 family protein [Candidatus Baltobacteraceae bacterium]